MDLLPFGLDEQWRPFIAIGFAVLLYVLAAMLVRALLKKVFLKPRISFHLAMMCFGVLCAAMLFYRNASWLTNVVSAMIISGVIALWVFFDRVFFSLYLARRQKVEVPNILRQMLAFVVLLVAVALVLTYGYGVKITGLLATSGVAAVILGFAMQDLLANVIAGFSIHMTKAYKVGDWLLLDGTGDRAEVREVNWRATRLINNDGVSIELPNSELVKSRITNLNYPNKEHRVRMQVGIDYDQPPNDVKEALLSAVTGANGVLRAPEPVVFLVEFGDSAVIYEIRFWMRQAKLYNRTCDEIRTKIWYELSRRNIRIPFPIQSLEMRTPNEPLRMSTASASAAEILREATCMSCLSEQQAEMLVKNATKQLFAARECVVREGDHGDSMYVILNGEVEVDLKLSGGSMEKIATLGHGNYFGEMSLMTGEPRSATIRALEDTLVLVISKQCIAPVLQEQPELMESISRQLAKRQTEIEALQAEREQSGKKTTPAKKKPEVIHAGLLDKIRDFFGH
ncbi:mechanosensitive ion channel protein MscS [Oceaniferula spumae]|uniref:Mechanosensitive ion channel protein MscS n=1 Tax=Oceaniferula spumae TaxID=2979115 RepID=A0AAT9FSE7_9BACT